MVYLSATNCLNKLRSCLKIGRMLELDWDRFFVRQSSFMREAWRISSVIDAVLAKKCLNSAFCQFPNKAESLQSFIPFFYPPLFYAGAVLSKTTQEAQP